MEQRTGGGRRVARAGQEFQLVVAELDDLGAEPVPVLAERGIQLWLRETDGPVDLADPEHRALMVLLG